MIYTSITASKDNPRPDVQNFNKYNKFKQPVLNAKFPKICPHFFFQATESIWIDGNVRLLRPEADYYALLGAKSIGVFKHPVRDCLYDEAQTCLTLGLDRPETIAKQVSTYMENFYPPHAGLGACFLIVRRHTSEVLSLCESWWSHICAFSKRDQISFPYIFRDQVQYFTEPTSEWFTRGAHTANPIPENKLEAWL